MSNPVESADRRPTAAPTGGGGLTGKMGVAQLVLTVLAFSSPLTSLAGYFSLAIMSTGETAPVAFAVVTVVLLVFSVGYVAMTVRMPRPGAFYAFISEGLGRHMGLAAALLATLSYAVIGMGVYCFVGATISDLITSFGGPPIPWWLGTLLVWAIIAILGYLNVDVSAKLLMYVMLVEVAIVMIFNVAILGRGGESGLSLAPLDVVAFGNGEIWVGLLFAMLVFVGFEATALYRDEVKDPDRTIPRATYSAVLFIGVLYTVTVWLMVLAFGSNAQQVATDDTAGMFAQAADRYIGAWFSNVAVTLVITAVLAAILSIHNASTRYLFNLGADGALPGALGRAHPRHRSPYRASMAISALGFVGVAVFTVAGRDPSVVYGQLAGLGNAGIFTLMALVSIAVVVWFQRNGKQGAGVWATLVAPLISAIAMVALVGFALANFDLVAGDAAGNQILLVLLGASFVAGLVLAAYLKARRPAAFRRLGGTDR